MTVTHQYKAVLALILLWLTMTSVSVTADEAMAQIQVTGQGERAVVPDMAIMKLTVMREAETARAALDANSAAMDEVIRSMRREGVAGRDMQTAGVSITPRYVYPKPRTEAPPKIVGYTVRNSLTVRVRELQDLGKLLDQSVTLGVNEGGNITFTNEAPAELLADARAEAVKNALAKAETLADAADVDLGDILSISEQFSNPRPYMASRGMMAADSVVSAVPVAAGENSYTVTVHMTIAIDQ